MKKLVIISVAAVSLLSCTHDFSNYGTYVDPSTLQDKDPSEVTQEDIQANVASIFGTIDPEQDWNMVKSGEVTITADANLSNIVKVQILSESPYFNPSAAVLCEAEVQNGGAVTLNYEAPAECQRLIAVCINNEGSFYTKGFDIGATNVSFASRSTTRSMTRGTNDCPNPSAIKMEVKNSSKSFNAARTQYANLATVSNNDNLKQWVKNNHLNLWQDRGWENERLWKATANNNAGSGWIVDDKGTIYRTVADISKEEEDELKDIFNTSLARNSTKDNLALIRNSSNVTLYTNHLISDGTPVIVSPVQLASKEINYCVIYYYYYNPSDIPATMSEEEYVKKLPKFELINCAGARWGAQQIGKSKDNSREDFFKVREYILPYYGDNIHQSAMEGFETDGEVYRIRHAYQYQNKDQYLSYGDKGKLARCNVADFKDENDVNYAYQLWQVFTNPETKQSYLFNIGLQRFLLHDEATLKDYLTPFSDTDILDEKAIPVVIDTEKNCILRSNSTTMGLGTDLDNPNKAANRYVSSDKDPNKATGMWYFEKIGQTEKSGLLIKDKIEMMTPVTAQSMVIPTGYKIGFMIRKVMNGDDLSNRSCIAGVANGCSYGFGSMNREINQFPGHFASAVTAHSMKIDDPRILMFCANDKTYLAFEEGCDCQYSDAIIEITQGVNIVEDPMSVEAITYTVCIEDRPIADYDLNDIVIKAKRVVGDRVRVELSLVACGASDDLYICGLNGQLFNENNEVHDLFQVERGTFVNTTGGTKHDPVTEIFEIGNTTSLMDFLKSMTIYDATIDHYITFSGRSDDPHAIVIPYDFKYPLERKSIIKAYPTFRNWTQNRNVDNNWYKSPMDGDVIE